MGIYVPLYALFLSQSLRFLLIPMFMVLSCGLLACVSQTCFVLVLPIVSYSLSSSCFIYLPSLDPLWSILFHVFLSFVSSKNLICLELLFGLSLTMPDCNSQIKTWNKLEQIGTCHPPHLEMPLHCRVLNSLSR